jgi:hypothetical protein
MGLLLVLILDQTLWVVAGLDILVIFSHPTRKPKVTVATVGWGERRALADVRISMFILLEPSTIQHVLVGMSHSALGGERGHTYKRSLWVCCRCCWCVYVYMLGNNKSCALKFCDVKGILLRNATF